MQKRLNFALFLVELVLQTHRQNSGAAKILPERLCIVATHRHFEKLHVAEGPMEVEVLDMVNDVRASRFRRPIKHQECCPPDIAMALLQRGRRPTLLAQM